jgi:hypothetical protein
LTSTYLAVHQYIFCEFLINVSAHALEQQPAYYNSELSFATPPKRRLAAALLLLYCCFTAALLLLYCCFYCTLLLLLLLLHLRIALRDSRASASALMLLYCCFNAALLLLYCCFTCKLRFVTREPRRPRSLRVAVADSCHGTARAGKKKAQTQAKKKSESCSFQLLPRHCQRREKEEKEEKAATQARCAFCVSVCAFVAEAASVFVLLYWPTSILH